MKRRTKTPGNGPPRSRTGVLAGARRTGARTLAIRAKQQRALDLRLAGHTYDAIARELRYADHSSARLAVLAVLDRQERPAADELRRIEAARIDALTAPLWDRATGKAPPGVVHDDSGRGVAALTQDTALDRLTKLMDRRARLLGLDAPTRQEVHAIVSEEEVRALVSEVRQAVYEEARAMLGEAQAAELDARVEARIRAGQGPPG